MLHLKVCLLAFIAPSVCVFTLLALNQQPVWRSNGDVCHRCSFVFRFSQITAKLLKKELRSRIQWCFEGLWSVPILRLVCTCQCEITVSDRSLRADGGGSRLKVSFSNTCLQICHVRYCKPSVHGVNAVVCVNLRPRPLQMRKCKYGKVTVSLQYWVVSGEHCFSIGTSAHRHVVTHRWPLFKVLWKRKDWSVNISLISPLMLLKHVCDTLTLAAPLLAQLGPTFLWQYSSSELQITVKDNQYRYQRVEGPVLMCHFGTELLLEWKFD